MIRSAALAFWLLMELGRVGVSAETKPAGDAPALESPSEREPRSTPAATAKKPVDQLIPWLLDEDRQLRGVPFSEVIFDTTGKKVLRADRKNEVDLRVIMAISKVCEIGRAHV